MNAKTRSITGPAAAVAVVAGFTALAFTALAIAVPRASSAGAGNVVTVVRGEYLPLGTEVATDCHWESTQPLGDPWKNPGHFYIDGTGVYLHAGFASLEDQSSTVYASSTPVTTSASERQASKCIDSSQGPVPPRSPMKLRWTGVMTLLSIHDRVEWDQVGNRVENWAHTTKGIPVPFQVYDPESPCTFRVTKLTGIPDGPGARRALRPAESYPGEDDVPLRIDDIVSSGDTIFSGLNGEVGLTANKLKISLPSGFETTLKLSAADPAHCERARANMVLLNGQAALDLLSGGPGLQFHTVTEESTTEGGPAPRALGALQTGATGSRARYKVWRLARKRTTVSYALRGSIVVEPSWLHPSQTFHSVIARAGQRVVAVAGHPLRVLGKPNKR